MDSEEKILMYTLFGTILISWSLMAFIGYLYGLKETNNFYLSKGDYNCEIIDKQK